MIDRELAAIARSRHGLITADDIRRIGLTRRQLRRRLENGSMVRISESVLAVSGAPVTWAQRATAALHAVPNSVLSHDSAARLHPLEGIGSSEGVTITAGLEAYHQLSGVTVRRTRLLPSEHVVLIGGLPVTSVARTLVDLGADLQDARLTHVVERALAARQVGWDDLVDIVRSMSARGRPGVGRVRRVLTRIEGQPPTESHLERMYLDVLRRRRIPLPEMQVRAPWSDREPGRVDAMYRSTRSIVELDGRTWHSRNQAFENDRRRDQLATMNGFRTVRFTYRQVANDPEHVAAVSRSMATGQLHR